MNQTPFEVDDAIVLILGAPTKHPALKDRLEGITRLEKLIFLLEWETEAGKLLTERPEFKPHHFGPFSAKIYQAVEVLKAAGLLEETGRLSESPEDSWESAHLILGDDAQQYTTRDFFLTEKGRRYYDALASELPNNAVKAASKLKDQFGSLPLRQLIRYVYQRHEPFTERSIIRDQVLGTEASSQSGADAEKLLIERALRVCEGNKTRAASMLGIARQTLHAKLMEYAIGDDAEDNESS